MKLLLSRLEEHMLDVSENRVLRRRKNSGGYRKLEIIVR